MLSRRGDNCGELGCLRQIKLHLVAGVEDRLMLRRARPEGADVEW
jgi:hypothetical protein